MNPFDTCFRVETMSFLCENYEVRENVTEFTLISTEWFAAKKSWFMVGRTVSYGF